MSPKCQDNRIQQCTRVSLVQRRRSRDKCVGFFYFVYKTELRVYLRFKHHYKKFKLDTIVNTNKSTPGITGNMLKNPCKQYE